MFGILRIVCNMRLGVVGGGMSLPALFFDFSDTAFFLVDIVL